MSNGRTMKLRDIGYVRDSIDKARAAQEAVGKPLTVQAIAWQLGVHRATVLAYANRDNAPEGADRDTQAVYDAVSELLAQAVAECDVGISNILLEKGNNMGAVLIAKNCYGYKDKTEQEVAVQLPTFSGESELK